MGGVVNEVDLKSDLCQVAIEYGLFKDWQPACRAERSGSQLIQPINNASLRVL